VIPWGSNAILADVNVGVLYLFAITSLAFHRSSWPVGLQQQYSMYGGMRAVAQLLAFEVPLTLSAWACDPHRQPQLQHVVGAQTTCGSVPADPRRRGVLVAGMGRTRSIPLTSRAESELVTGYFTSTRG